MIKRRDFLTVGGSLVAGAALGLVGAARAHEYDVGKLKVEHPWLRAPAEGSKSGVFYAFLHNNGDSPDKLIAVKCEKVGKTEIHGDAKNLSLETPVVLPPKSKVTLAPGSIHVDLMEIKKHLEVGWGLEMTLVFEKAGEVVIDAAIEAPDAMHAHDAEAQARWEKAQGKEPSAKAGEHDHHEHHHDEKKHEDAH